MKGVGKPVGKDIRLASRELRPILQLERGM